MILAAGYGTRLWPLTIDRAKPAIPFMGRPLVGYVAEYLARFGFKEIAVNLHHRGESVRAALGDGSSFGVRFQYVEEPTILGTGGALDNAREFLDADTFIVVNGKIATDINLDAALETHRRTRALATLVLRENAARERYSMVEVRDRLVTGFGGNPTSDNASGAGSAAQKELPNAKNEFRQGQGEEFGERRVEGRVGVGVGPTPLMFTGIQILDPRIFDYIPRGVFSHTVTDTYVPAIARGERVAAHVAEGMWYELSTLQRYLDISLALLKAQGRNVYVGNQSRIENDAHVRDSVLWNNVVIGGDATVFRSVIGDGVHIGASERIENAVVVRREVVAGKTPPRKALKGHLEGDKFVVPLTQ